MTNFKIYHIDNRHRRNLIMCFSRFQLKIRSVLLGLFAVSLVMICMNQTFYLPKKISVNVGSLKSFLPKINWRSNKKDNMREICVSSLNKTMNNSTESSLCS